MTNPPEITLVRGEDWEGMYVNDELVAEGHSLDARVIIEALKLNLKPTIFIDYDWLEKRGTLPRDLKEVPRD